MNLKAKLIGDEDERAVSPVIGVILMVAITVILAAVIAAFVLDLGSGLEQEAQSGAQIDWDGTNNEMKVTLTSEGNADAWEIRGDVSGGPHTLTGAGDTQTLTCGSELTSSSSGTVTVVATITETDTTTQIGSEEFECP